MALLQTGYAYPNGVDHHPYPRVVCAYEFIGAVLPTGLKNYEIIHIIDVRLILFLHVDPLNFIDVDRVIRFGEQHPILLLALQHHYKIIVLLIIDASIVDIIIYQNKYLVQVTPKIQRPVLVV
jgi:hypothetical protein